MADLVGFHRREAKPAWWAFFDRQERSAEELAEDADCLGGCVADGEDWIGREKRSLTFRYRYPEQETKLTAGSAVHLAAGGESAGTIIALDETARTVTVKRGMGQGELPREASFIPGGPIKDRVLRNAVWAVAADMAGDGSAFPHIHALLRRDPPRLTGRTPGRRSWPRPTATIRRGCSRQRSAPCMRSIAPGSSSRGHPAPARPTPPRT